MNERKFVEPESREEMKAQIREALDSYVEKKDESLYSCMSLGFATMMDLDPDEWEAHDIEIITELPGIAFFAWVRDMGGDKARTYIVSAGGSRVEAEAANLLLRSALKQAAGEEGFTEII